MISIPQNPLWRAAAYVPSLLFRAAAAGRAAAYRRGHLETVRLPVPVLCVGNITVGGTGKTPAVIWLAEFLKKKGRRPAVITRGYGGSGDEPGLISARLPDVPVIADPDRARAGRRAVETGADCLIMDDGFQHFRLHRDLDLVCVDAMRPFADDACLPAGTLREPVAGLTRAGVIFLTKVDFIPDERRRDWAVFFATVAPGVPVVPVSYGLGGDFRGKRVLALSGLARPESFEEALRRQGADVAALRYADHHVFTPAERAEASKRAEAEGRTVVVTEKDRRRLPDDFACKTARLEWIPEERPEWVRRIESAIS